MARSKQTKESPGRSSGWLMVAALVAVTVAWAGRRAGPNLTVNVAAGMLAPYAAPVRGRCDGHPVRLFDRLRRQINLGRGLQSSAGLRAFLDAAAVDAESIDAVVEAIGDDVEGVRVRMAADRFGAVSAIEAELPTGGLVQGCWDDRGFQLRKVERELQDHDHALTVVIGADADLTEAVQAAGESPELARRIAEVLVGRLDPLTDLRGGDRVDVVVRKRFRGRVFHGYREIVALRFHGQSHRFESVRFDPDGVHEALYIAPTRQLSGRFLRTPVGWYEPEGDAAKASYAVTDRDQGWLEVRVAEGAPVIALAEGTVRDEPMHDATGTLIGLTADEDWVVEYDGLLRSVGGLHAGGAVEQGEVIGIAGPSNIAPGGLVRVRLRHRGEIVDPRRVLRRSPGRTLKTAAGTKRRFAAAMTRARKLWREAKSRG